MGGTFAPDGVYWIPSNKSDVDPQREVSIVYDDIARLRERVTRLKSGSLWAQDPPSRTTRLVSNIMIAEHAEEHCLVQSRFLTVELRRGRSHTFSGTNRHTLTQVNGEWKIREKVVYFIQNNEPIANLTFLL